MGKQTAKAELDEKINKFKKRREQIKSQLKRFYDFVSNVKDDKSQVTELKCRLGAIEPVYEEFNNIILELEVLEPGFDGDRERDKFEKDYFFVISDAKKLITSLTEVELPRHNSVQNINSFNGNGFFGGAKLPSLGLPKFRGDYDKWTQFYETFCTLVHDNAQLDEIQKFYYLLDSLDGNARKVLDCLEITRSNYSVALDLLEKRFYNKPVIIQTHLKALFDAPVVQKEAHHLLRSLVDLIAKHIRALKSLGEPVENWDRLVIFFMSRKLDIQTKKEWEEKIISSFDGNPKLDDFLDFLSNKCRILESVDSSSKIVKTTSSRTALTTLETGNVKCEFCKGEHFVYSCDKLKSLSVSERREQVKKAKLCFNCLRSSHQVKECRAEGCKKCKQRHNVLLHTESKDSTSRTNSQGGFNNKEEIETENKCLINSTANDSDYEVAACSAVKQNNQVILSTAVVQIKDKFGRFVKCRVLLDSGSQVNFITQSLSNKLNLDIKKTNIPITGVGQKVINILRQARTTIRSLYNNYSTEVNLLVIDNVTANVPIRSFDSSNLEIPPNLKLADPDFNQSSKIDLLIGASLFFDLICAGQIKLSKNGPILQKSVFGWIVSGPLPGTDRANQKMCNFVVQNDMQEQLEKFWRLEECGMKKPLSVEEIECEESFSNSVARDKLGRFSVALPLKDTVSKLGDSLEGATKRFLSLERKLLKNSELKSTYSEFINEYQELGHMTKLEKNEIRTENNVYYLPHHGVINESSLTTKLRVVLDASFKTSTDLSLNDVLKVGPTVQDELFEILVRFRQGSVVITADVEKMFRQINVVEEHRDLQRILWRSDPNFELEHFRLNTLTYGTACASFLSTRCLKQISLDLKDKLPQISRIIEKSFYVDDLIATVSSVDEAIEVSKTLITEFEAYGFPLRKWASNKKEVIEHLSQTEVTNPGYFITENDSKKTLGIFWRADEDFLEFVIKIEPFESSRVTKRLILSVISQIFDPLGLVGPVTLRAKIILQKLWQLKLQWDESIPLNLFTLWNQFYSRLDSLNELKIPRQCTIDKANYFEIHGFSDASETAYGACVYLRSCNAQGEVLVRLICAKSRVAPLKSVSLPRLELCGAVLLVQLVSKVVSAIDLNISKVFLWCDSTITLAWIAEEPRTWKVFVANRVAEIQDISKAINAEWNHISSGDNPADIISRTIDPEHLKPSHLWWNGPRWLENVQESWPRGAVGKSNYELIPEKRKDKLSFATTVEDTSIFERYSCLYKLNRVIGWCLRFYKNLRSDSDNRKRGDLSVWELDNALHKLIKIVQEQEFSLEIKSLSVSGTISNNSNLRSLDPFLDNELIRVGGRLRHSNESYNVRYPILLPKNHLLTKLIIRDQHQKQLHAGPQIILAKLRQQYWIISGRSAVRSVLSKCITCFRNNPASLTQKMGNLPKDRVVYQRPFSICGVDYAGPFNMKDGKLRNRRIVKGYMCLFVCFVTKAVHIELAGDMTTSTFLDCLKRFVSRRGLCSKVYSDNGTNFVGANNELKRLRDTLIKIESDDKVKHYCNQQGIDWQYIPPRSPHQGGLWESSIKSAKRILVRVIGNTSLTFEQLSTVLCQVEAVLNSRPLTPLSSTPNDFQVLTPGHFLTGDALNAVPQTNVTEISLNKLDKYHMLQRMVQHMWNRWSLEYLTTLQERSKWQKTFPNIQSGAMVLLKEENTPPLNWKLGRVIDVHPGRDGIIRVVSIRTPQGVAKRAIQKICVLPNVDKD